MRKRQCATLYLRVDDRNRPEFAAAGWQPHRGSSGPTRKMEIKGYIEDANDMPRRSCAALSAALDHAPP